MILHHCRADRAQSGGRMPTRCDRASLPRSWAVMPWQLLTDGSPSKSLIVYQRVPSASTRAAVGGRETFATGAVYRAHWSSGSGRHCNDTVRTCPSTRKVHRCERFTNGFPVSRKTRNPSRQRLAASDHRPRKSPTISFPTVDALRPSHATSAAPIGTGESPVRDRTTGRRVG